MATFGNIEAYDANSEQWSYYIERLEYFFIANNITTNDKKKAVVLIVCGAETYKLLRSLCTPNNQLRPCSHGHNIIPFYFSPLKKW